MEEQYRFKNRAGFIKTLDSVLPKEYIQERKIGSKIHCYYPAPIKEAVADSIFQYWNIVDEKYTILVNEIVCTVKIKYMPAYPGADELFCTGSASTPIQMDANSKVNDFPAKKKINALEYNLPSVISEATSKALGRLGNVFGRNLDRKLSKDKILPPDFTLRKHAKEEDKKKQEEPPPPPKKKSVKTPF